MSAETKKEGTMLFLRDRKRDTKRQGAQEGIDLLWKGLIGMQPTASLETATRSTKAEETIVKPTTTS